MKIAQAMRALASAAWVESSLAWEQDHFQSGMDYGEVVAAWGVPKSDLVRAPVANRKFVSVLQSRSPSARLYFT
jgi:hypothetical protein